MSSHSDHPLQWRAGRWSRLRFPDAEACDIALKAAEEVGELAQVVGTVAGRNDSHKLPNTLAHPFTEESADAVVALMVLVERYTPDDLLSVVDRKISMLETPGAHRASVRETP